MLDPYLTLERVVTLNPCHAPEKIQAWYPGRKRVRLSTVLRDTRISHADRIWLAVRVLPRHVVDRWLESVVERAVRQSVGKSDCPAWEDWATRWLDGTDRTAGAAWAAWARAVTAGAAWAARAAYAAAEVEVEWIARAADAAAADAAAVARDAADAAERDQQIADLLEIIKTYKETDHAKRDD